MNYSTSSWKQRREHKNNKSKTAALFITTLILIVFFLAFGLPLVVRLATLLYEFRSSSEAITNSDTTPPPPPIIFSVPKNTKNDTLNLRGSSEPGSTITVFTNRNSNETLVDNEGNFNVEISLVEGENNFYAISKDSSGNESKQSKDYTVTFDKTAPELIVTKPSDGQKFFGDEQKQISIEGETEESTIVNINSSRAVIFGGGKFSKLFELHEGENIFNISSEDPSGNKTEQKISVYFYP